MDNVYKVKIHTDPDPRWLYPSERRYSASIVLGLGVVHLAFALLALLMACLTVTSYTTNHDIFVNKTKEDIINRTIGQHRFINNQTDLHEKINPSTTLTAGPCLLCIGAIGAGFTALLAWKRWYIDKNIKWFFCMSLLSTTTSTISLILLMLLIIFVNDSFDSNIVFKENFNPSAKDIITINILIASILEWLWSILSIKVSYVGMKNNYPDDLVISRRGGKIEINTIHRGNVKGKIIQPDILNHYCIAGKICKHKKPNGNLPKDESNSEYYERVNKFLSSEIDSNSTRCNRNGTETC